MSSDLWDELGLVRTEELLQADRYYCATQFFSTAADYGFSKALDEALGKYPKDQVYYDVVRVVRMTRPLIITSVFVGGPSDGHGQHAASGMWAQKVFEDAGNPNVFPDQIKAGLRPWNPLKDYARVPSLLEEGMVSPKGLYDYATHHWLPAGVENYISSKFEPGAVSATVEIPVGTYLSMDGLSAQQISRSGLGYQRSQNGGGDLPHAGPGESPITASGRASSRRTWRNPSSTVSILRSPALPRWPNEEHAFSHRGSGQDQHAGGDGHARLFAARADGVAPRLAEGLKATNQLIDQVNCEFAVPGRREIQRAA